MVGTLLKNWLETHALLSTDLGLVKKQRRDIQRLQGDESKEVKAAREIDAAFATGEKMIIKTAFAAYKRVLQKELDELTDIIIKHKTLLNRNLNHLEDIEVSIVEYDRIPPDKLHAQLNASTRDNRDERRNALILEETLKERKRVQGLLHQKVRQMFKDIEQAIEDMLKKFASYHSINLSTLRLLDRSSQLRDLYYQIKSAFPDEREFKKSINAINSIERRARTVPQEKRIENALEKLESELKRETTAISEALLILQELQLDIQKKKTQIEHARDTDNYPPMWAQDNIEGLETLNMKFEKWLKDEIAEGRIFLSNAERKTINVDAALRDAA